MIAYSAMTLVKNNIYSLRIKINKIGTSSRMFIGIIPGNYDIGGNKPLTNVGNCYVYFNYGYCFHNSNCMLAKRYWINHVIKFVIDLKCGLICFENISGSNMDNIVAFKINKCIAYKFIFGTHYQGDSYQLLS